MQNVTVGISKVFQWIASEDEICGHRCGLSGISRLLTVYCSPRALVGRHVGLTMWTYLEAYLIVCEVKVYGSKHSPGEHKTM